MAMDKDKIRDILSGNVSEVKDALEDLDVSDYKEILAAEKEDKNRVTIKRYIEDKLEEAGETVEEAAEAVDDIEDAAESVEEEMEDEMEEIEQEMVDEQDFLLGFSPGKVVAGGIIFGLLVGVIAGLGASSYVGPSSPDAATSSVASLLEASGFQSSQYTIENVEKRHGLYYMTVQVEQQQGNNTTTQSLNYYVSQDGVLLVREQINTPFGSISGVVNIPQTIQEMEAQQANQTTNQTG